MMVRHEFEELIARSLSGPLPGVESQYAMAPMSRSLFSSEEIRARNPRIAAVLAAFVFKNQVPHLVLIKRQEYPGAHSGQISFPGGRVEEGETLEMAAIRETEEEIGVSRSEFRLLGSLTDLYIPVSNFQVFPFVGVFDSAPTYIPDQVEVNSVLEVPLTHFLDPANRVEREVSGKTFKLKVPAYTVEQDIIWGATAMMISELTGLISTNAK